LALPGVLVVAGESLIEACHRALVTKAGTVPGAVRWMRRVGVHDSPVRDERGPTISISYLAVIEDPEASRRPSNRAYDLSAVPKKLPFDHTAIIAEALGWAAEHLWDEDGSLALALLGPEFSTVRMNGLLSQLDPGFNTTNTTRMLSAQPCLTKTATGPSTGGRPATVWSFTGRRTARDR
jgi:ADP-ribose pyrophosphatase YjhB (NUDIX family)